MNASENNKFNWGDTVIIKKNAPLNFHAGEIASICSVMKIELDPCLEESSWLYTVELGDGNSVEIPESYLEMYDQK